MSPSRGLGAPDLAWPAVLLTLLSLAATPAAASLGSLLHRAAASSADAGGPARRGLAQSRDSVPPHGDWHPSRRLQQLQPPGSNGPCTPAQTNCTGSNGASRCCSTANYVCGETPAGAPYCVTCWTQFCPFTCLPGTTCTKNHNGCFECLKPCAAADACPAYQVCAPAGPGTSGTWCRTNPCYPEWSPCAANGTTCQLTPTYAAHCVSACTNDTDCAAGEFCGAGVCRVNPCKTTSCPPDRPTCVLSANFTAQCVPRELGAGGGCKTPCGQGFKCQQQPGGAWACVRTHIRRPPRIKPVRRASVRRSASAAAAARAAARRGAAAAAAAAAKKRAAVAAAAKTSSAPGRRLAAGAAADQPVAD